MITRSFAFGALALATSASALPSGSADIGTPTGEATRACIDTRQIREQRIVDDRTILFRVGKAWYRNDIPQACAGLRAERAFSYRTPSGPRLCEIDIITVFDPRLSVSYGSCGLGKFTPVALAGK